MLSDEPAFSYALAASAPELHAFAFGVVHHEIQRAFAECRRICTPPRSQNCIAALQPLGRASTNCVAIWRSVFLSWSRRFITCHPWIPPAGPQTMYSSSSPRTLTHLVACTPAAPPAWPACPPAACPCPRLQSRASESMLQRWSSSCLRRVPATNSILFIPSCMWYDPIILMRPMPDSRPARWRPPHASASMRLPSVSCTCTILSLLDGCAVTLVYRKSELLLRFAPCHLLHGDFDPVDYV